MIGVVSVDGDVWVNVIELARDHFLQPVAIALRTALGAVASLIEGFASEGRGQELTFRSAAGLL